MSDQTQNPGNTGDNNPAGEQPGAGADGQPKAINVDQLSAQLRRAEKALEAERNKTAAYEKEKSDKADAEKTELERQKARADAAESKLADALAAHKDAARRNAFRFAVDKLGATNADDVLHLADLSSIEVDETGKVTGHDELAKALKKSKAYLFGSVAPKAGDGGGNPPGGAPAEVTPEMVRKMTPQQLAEWRKSLQR